MKELKFSHKFFPFIGKHSFFIVLIILFAWLFFYHLGSTSLGSWDEAWYGSITREMIKNGDYIHLNWNGKPFYDHPPMGFWLMAASYKIFGVSEFSTRFPSAILGLFTILFIYLLGKKISKEKIVGFGAALILGTSVWYVIRVRSGNLDSIFLFFYVSTIYFGLLAKEKMKWFPVCMAFFGGLIMSKTLVGASALPILLAILIPEFIKIKRNLKWILIGFTTFFAIVFPWYWIHYKTYSDFIQHHFFDIGSRSKSFDSYFKLQYQLPLFYLHMGIRKWYYLWIISAGYLILFCRFLKRNIFILLLWNVVILYPFLTTDQTSIWHLIPVYAPLALVISYGFWDMGLLFLKLLQSFKITHFKKLKLLNKNLLKFGYLCGFLFIVFLQIKTFYPEVFPQNIYIPDDVDISMKVSRYPQKIYLDDDYLPLAVFYSNRFMNQMAYESEDRRTLVKLFKNEKESFVVITRNWAVDNLMKNNLSFKILEQNDSFSIVTKP